MFEEFRIRIFCVKKNVRCKKLFDVPLVDDGVDDGVEDFFSPPSSPSSLGSPISLGLPVFPALPTLSDLSFF